MGETITIGPFHPELEESVYFKLVADENQTVTEVNIMNGLIHRGLEAMITNRNFMQNLILTERVCSLCSNTHPWAYAMGVEAIAGIKVPPRGEALRVIAEEVKRIASNLFNLGLLCHLAGQHSLMGEILETREIMQDVKEVVWGNRMDMSANTLTGVRYDLDEYKENFIKTSLAKVRDNLVNLEKKFIDDDLIQKKTRGVGILDKDKAMELGVTGPVARGCGINNDVRVKAPYSYYKKYQPDVSRSLQKDGDIYARALARWGDTAEACRIVNDIINKLPEGAVSVRKRPHIPAGEAVVRVEAPRGELIYYVQTDGSQKPARIRWRVPTFINWESLKVMIEGNKVDQVTTIINSIDPCASCTDR